MFCSGGSVEAVEVAVLSSWYDQNTGTKDVSAWSQGQLTDNLCCGCSSKCMNVCRTSVVSFRHARTLCLQFRDSRTWGYGTMSEQCRNVLCPFSLLCDTSETVGRLLILLREPFLVTLAEAPGVCCVSCLPESLTASQSTHCYQQVMGPLSL